MVHEVHSLFYKRVEIVSATFDFFIRKSQIPDIFFTFFNGNHSVARTIKCPLLAGQVSGCGCYPPNK